MNQPQSNPPNPKPTPKRTPKPKTSRLAIAAIILAAVPCCPLVSLVGAAIGVTAWRRIHASKGTIAGGRLAAWAVIIGVLMAILSATAMSYVSTIVDQTNRQIMVEEITTTINSSIDGDMKSVQAVWMTSADPRLAAEGFQSFGRSIQERYGVLTRFTISSTVTTGSVFQPQYEVAGIFIFERGELIGSARFDVRTTTTELWPRFRLKSLVIEDHERGDLHLPPGESSPVPPTAGTEPSS